jgi:hypothetical protein
MTAKITPLQALDKALMHHRHALHWNLAAMVMPPESKSAAKAAQHAADHNRWCDDYLFQVREALNTQA